MKTEIRQYLEGMREEFMSFTYDQVVAVKWQERGALVINGNTYYPAVWSQTFPDGEALLVVQLTRRYFFKLLAATDCIGFTLTKSGERFLVDACWLMHEVGYP